MGHAARAKQKARAEGRTTTCGNPEPWQPMATVISQKKYTEAVRRGDKIFEASFSDRKYAMDKNGTLRRLPPAPPPSAGTVSITRSTEPSL